MGRPVDLCVGGLLLVLSLPLQVAIAVAIRLTCGGPVLFGQTRLGRDGVPFTLHKFRTLSSAHGPVDAPTATVAAANDARATLLGRWLRRWRLDELPQLHDVVRGRMALVGPRPEVPGNLECVDGASIAQVLRVRPGLTGPTQLAFVAEDEVLAGEASPQAVYRRVLVPEKVARDLAWLARRTFWSDFAVLVRTPWAVVSPRARHRSRTRVAALLAAAAAR